MVGKIVVNPLIIMNEEEIEKEKKSLPGFSAVLLTASLIVGAIYSRRSVDENF